MKETGKRPSFWRMWGKTSVWTAVGTCVVYVGVFTIGSFVVELQGGTSLPYALLGAVGGLFWAATYLIVTGWVVILVVTTIIAVVGYVVALLH